MTTMILTALLVVAQQTDDAPAWAAATSAAKQHRLILINGRQPTVATRQLADPAEIRPPSGGVLVGTGQGVQSCPLNTPLMSIFIYSFRLLAFITGALSCLCDHALCRWM